MTERFGILLIGGTSHVGKSTLAGQLARRLGCQWLSTDSLARHPGRPWKPPGKQVPAHVAEHYLSLEVEELVQDVLAHYRCNVRPLVEARIQDHLRTQAAGWLILEGSALWPDWIASAQSPCIRALLLTAPDELLKQRILSNSDHATRSGRERKMIEKFLARTLEYNRRMIAAAGPLGLRSLQVRAQESPAQLLQRCMEALGLGGSEQIPDRPSKEDHTGQADDPLDHPCKDGR